LGSLGEEVEEGVVRLRRVKMYVARGNCAHPRLTHKLSKVIALVFVLWKATTYRTLDF
jgi:hypothetical protein